MPSEAQRACRDGVKEGHPRDSNQYVQPNNFQPSFGRLEPSGESIMLLLKVGAVPLS